MVSFPLVDLNTKTETIIDGTGSGSPQDISGGKVLRSRTLKTDNRAGQASRSGQAAASVTRSNSAFGASYRRKRAQLGPAQALVATAHKIALV